MTQGKVDILPPIPKIERDDILDALGLSESDLDERCPVQIVSTGASKIMVGISRRDTLNALKPDLVGLSDISRTIGCNGYFVFTLNSDSETVLTSSRMFAPAIGIPEDPVTGNGNGPLGAYLVYHNIIEATGGSVTFKGNQGEAIKRPGIVTVTVEVKDGKPFKVKVGGDATIAFKTEIEL
jgi:PhzF family phenazine biosynthesis protein